MFNLKWGLLAAAAGFVLALITSLLLGHTSFIIALLRAGLFGALFFGLGTGVWALINTYIPELFFSDSPDDTVVNPFATAESAGSRVNITVDDSGAALPDAELGPSSSGEVGDFNDLVSGAIRRSPPAPAPIVNEDIDQSPAGGYTDSGVDNFVPMFDTAAKTGGELGDFTMDFGAFVADNDSSPKAALDTPDNLIPNGSSAFSDSDSLMDSFSMFSSASDSGMFEEPAEQERKPMGNKNRKLDGDFNAKDIAAGLRTVLEKDKKG